MATRFTQKKRGNKKNGYMAQKKRGKKNGSKAQKKGGNLAGRKALNHVSNLEKPSALQPSRKHNSLNDSSIWEDFGVPTKKSKSPVMTEDPTQSKKLVDSGSPELPPGCYKVIMVPDNLPSPDLEQPDLPWSVVESKMRPEDYSDIAKIVPIDKSDYDKMMTEDDSNYEISWPETPCLPCFPFGPVECELRESPVTTEDPTPRQSKKLVDPVFGSPKSPNMLFKGGYNLRSLRKKGL